MCVNILVKNYFFRKNIPTAVKNDKVRMKKYKHNNLKKEDFFFFFIYSYNGIYYPFVGRFKPWNFHATETSFLGTR